MNYVEADELRRAVVESQALETMTEELYGLVVCITPFSVGLGMGTPGLES